MYYDGGGGVIGNLKKRMDGRKGTNMMASLFLQKCKKGSLDKRETGRAGSEVKNYRKHETSQAGNSEERNYKNKNKNIFTSSMAYKFSEILWGFV